MPELFLTATLTPFPHMAWYPDSILPQHHGLKLHKGIKVHKYLLVLSLLFVSACSYIPFSGDKLEGTLTPVPDDWTDISRPEVIQLETQPSDPYSVKLWVIGLGPNLYVHAGANRATWVEHIEADPNVRILIGEALYNLRATRVVEPGEYELFATAYEAKYDRRPRNENVQEIYLFRLQART
jgi:hypothetical protein